MWDNLIGQHIRRANRNLLVSNLILFSVLAIALIVTHRYFYNVFAGPLPVTHQDLLGIKNAGDQARYYVSVNDLAPKDTGFYEVERTKSRYTGEVRSERITAHYFYANVGGKLLLIQSPDGEPVSNYTGALVAVPDNVRTRIQTKSLDEVNRKFEDVFVPFMLDATSFKVGAYIGLGIGIPLALLALFNVLKAIKRGGNFDAHPIAKRLSKRYGQPAAVIAQAIDQDFKNSNILTPLKSVQISNWWLVRTAGFRTDIIALTDIVWIYQKVTKTYYSFIPTGQIYSGVIRDRFGGTIQLAEGRGNKQTAARMTGFLQVITSRVPWVIVGFSREWKQMYDKNRAQFIALVDQRRSQAGAARA